MCLHPEYAREWSHPNSCSGCNDDSIYRVGLEVGNGQTGHCGCRDLPHRPVVQVSDVDCIASDVAIPLLEEGRTPDHENGC